MLHHICYHSLKFLASLPEFVADAQEKLVEPESLLIVKLLGKVTGKGGAVAIKKLNSDFPPAVKRRIESYSIFGGPANSASPELLAIRAALELTWENLIRPLRGKTELQMQLDYGVSSFVPTANRKAVAEMREDRDALGALQTYCELLISDSGQILLTLRSAQSMGLKLEALFDGASQMLFDEAAMALIRQQCNISLGALREILPILDRIILKNQSDLSKPFGARAGF